MSRPVKPPWRPEKIRDRRGEPMGTSTCPFVVETDQGLAYLKAMGNPEGPSALACDLIGTRLASRLGLPVFDLAVLDLPRELCVPLGSGCVAEPGPALLARAVQGRTWDGTAEELATIGNPNAPAGLVVLDTWLRNRDRHMEHGDERICNERNVFLLTEGPADQLLAIDHTECLRFGRELTMRQLGIDMLYEERGYGLFPEFRAHVRRADVRAFVEAMVRVTSEEVAAVVGSVPREWLPADEVRKEIPGFCVRRAHRVAEWIEHWLESACSWQDTPNRGTST